MPRTIDDKIVEMRFDNRDFEKNTKQSMATLDKLKTSLDMSDAERNFNKISKASDEVSFTKASDSVDTFSVKLSAMSSVAVAAIGRITNQLMNLGEQFVRNLSGIDYMSSGFSKYEDIIGYQQTMLANAKNMSEEQMQELLDKLVWFSDETSFNADNMMQAMSSYIAAGADELTSQAAALGTALWAALTGNSNESLAIANRNLPQIFGKGYMQLQDWQSIVTAKMDAPWIREMFIETAGELKTLEKRADGFYTKIGKNWEKVDTSSFTSTFKGGWLNTEVLLKTFAKITKFTDEVYDEVNETGDLAFDVIRRLGKDIDDVGYKALKGAQETKTWTEAWEYVKGAVTAGWSRTFETLFGSFNTARDFFSKIVESLYSIFVEPGNTRNNIFKSWAEYTPYVAEDVEEVADKVEEVADKVNVIVTKLENARDIVLSIIRGNYGNGQVRVQALAERYGADVGRELQQVVNEVWKQWDGKNWSLNYELLDQMTANGAITRQSADAVKKAAETIEGGADSLDKVQEILNGRDDLLDGLSALAEGVAFIFDRGNYWFSKDSSLKALKLDAESLYNFTHKYAEKMRAFRDNVVLPDDYDETMRRLEEGFYTLDDIPEEDREFYTGEKKGFKANWVYPLLMNLRSVSEVLSDLVSPIKATFESIGKGFISAFFPNGEQSLYDYQIRLHNFLEIVKDLTGNLRPTEEQLAKLTTIFKGIFTPLRIVWKIISSIAGAISKVVDSATEAYGKKTIVDRLLEIGEGIANIIIGFDEWLEKTGAIDNFVIPAIRFLSDVLCDIWGWIKKLLGVDSSKAFPTFDEVFSGWQNAKKWIHNNIIVPIEDYFGIDLHIPTWDELAKGWDNVKKWLHDKVYVPFKELTGVDLQNIRWPSWDEIKSKWSGFKSWIHENIIVPIEDAFGIDLRFPTIDEVKDFFKNLWDFIIGLFGKNGKANAEEATETVEKQSKSWETLSNIFDRVLSIIKKLFEFIGQLFDYIGQNESLNAAFKTGLFAVALEFMSRLFDSAYGFIMLDPIVLINEIGDSISSLFYAAAEKKQSEAVLNLAKAIGVLVAAMLVLSLIPVDQMREGISVILELVAAMGTIAILLNKMSKTGGSSLLADKSGIMYESSYSDLYSVGRALLELAGAVAILSLSLKLISGIDNPTKLRHSLMAIEELLMAVGGVIILINNTAPKMEKTDKLGSASVNFLSVAVLIYALSKAIVRLSKIPNFSTESEAYKAVLYLLLAVGAIATTVAWMSQGATGKSSKSAGLLIGVMLTVITLVVIIAELTKEFTSIQSVHFGAIATSVAILIGAIAIIVFAVAKLGKSKAIKPADNWAILKYALGAMIVMQGLATIILAVGGAVAMIASSMKGMNEQDISNLVDIIGFITVVIASLTGIMLLLTVIIGGLFKSQNSSKIVSAMLAVGLMLGAISVAFVSVTSSLRLLSDSSMGPESILAAGISVSMVLSTIAGVVFLLITGINRIDTTSIKQTEMIGKLGGLSILMLAMAASIFIISGAMRVLADSKNGDDGIYTSLAAISLMLLVAGGVLAAIIAAVYGLTKYDIGSESIKKLLGISVLMVAMGAAVSAIALALSVLASNDSKSSLNAMFAMMGVLGLATVLVTVLSAFSAADTKMSSVVGALFAIAGAISMISLALAALVYAVGNEKVSGDDGIGALWASVGAIGALFAMLTAVSIIASIPMITAGFTAVTGLLIGIGAAAASFALGAVLIVSALVMLKDAIYDIGDNGPRFEAGVRVVFVSIANGFKESMPLILETLVRSADLISKALTEAFIRLLYNVNQRIPEIVQQIMASVFKVLDSLKEYIGPLVATIFDFLVDLLEGVAYAINTRGGRIIAALFDVVASIITLAMKLIGEVLVLFLGWIPGAADGIRDGIAQASSQVASHIGNAGTKIIEAEEESVDQIIKRSPRLAEYYTKYGETTEKAIEASSEGIETMLGKSGSGISGMFSDMLGGQDPTSLLGGALGNLNMTDSGNTAGTNFAGGFNNGLSLIDIKSLFPDDTADYYADGYSKGAAEQNGYIDSLWDGVRSGRLKTVQDVVNWIDEHGAAGKHDFIDQVVDMYNKGTLTTMTQLDSLWEDYKKNEVREGNLKTYTDTFTSYYNANKSKLETPVTYRDDDEGDVSGYQNRIEVLTATVDALNMLSKASSAEDINNVRTQLLNLAQTLDTYSVYPEFQNAAELIRDALENPDFTTPNTDPVIAALRARAEAFNEATTAVNNAKDHEEAVAVAEKISSNRYLFQKSQFSGIRKAAEDEMTEKILKGSKGLRPDVFAEEWVRRYSSLPSRIQALMRDMFNDPTTEAFNFLLLAPAHREIYTYMKQYWTQAAEASAEAMEQQNMFKTIWATFTGQGADAGAKEYFNRMVGDLAAAVPGYLEKVKSGLDATTRGVLERTNWAEIIANPDSIDQDAFRLLMSYLYVLGEDVAKNYVLGIVKGINDNAPNVEPAAERMAGGMAKITKSVLQIKSPSRVGVDIGKNFVLGVAEGVEDTADEAGLASEETALSMAQRLKNAISAAVGFNLEDLSPVIRPILDLDAITAGASQINGLVGGNMVYGRFGVGPAGYGDLQAIAQMNKTGLAQAIQESVLTQPVNQTVNNTFNIQSNDPNEVARRVSAILSSQVQRKQQVWGPAKVNRATQ